MSQISNISFFIYFIFSIYGKSAFLNMPETIFKAWNKHMQKNAIK